MATAGSALGGPRTIVGVRVTNIGSDMGSITPMLDQIDGEPARCRTYFWRTPITPNTSASSSAHREASRR